MLISLACLEKIPYKTQDFDSTMEPGVAGVGVVAARLRRPKLDRHQKPICPAQVTKPLFSIASFYRQHLRSYRMLDVQTGPEERACGLSTGCSHRHLTATLPGHELRRGAESDRDADGRGAGCELQ